jgi:hypothetical protein
MSKPKDQSAPDPRPTPPVEPQLEDCCGNGCDPCVFDTYQMAMDRYRAALAAWEAKQATSTKRGIQALAASASREAEEK